MENIKKLKPTKELWIKIKWMANYAKPAIPFLIFSIIVNVIFSLIGIYNVTVSKSLIDSAISGDSKQTIYWLIIMLVITLISMLSSPVTSFMSTHSSTKLTQNIQRKIYQHLQCSDWLEQSKFHSVSLLTRVTSDVSNISSAILGTIPSLVSLTVTLVGSFYTLINWAPSIAFVAVFIGPFLILVGRYFSGKLKSLYKEAQEEDVKYRSFMQESIQNIMIVKTFCMEKINMHKLLEIQDNKYKIAMRNTRLSVMTSMSMSFCSSLAYFSIFTWGVLNIAKGVTTYGTFTGMLQLYNKVQAPFSSLASMIPGLISTIAAAERLMEIETIPVEKMADENELNDITNKSLDEIAVDNITNFESTLFNNPDIIFDNVYFAYKDNNYILNKINLTIDSGETIAFVGPSGEGKTTMIRLILSLINPTEGNLFITDRIKELMKTSNGKYIAPQYIEGKIGKDKFIEQIAIIADAKKYVSALIVPCFDSVEEYAKKLNIKYQDRMELLKHSEIIKMFEQRIESLQKELAHFEQVKKFTLLSQAFSVKLGEITPTLKLRRKVIMERYRHIIDSMYSNNKENKKNKE